MEVGFQQVAQIVINFKGYGRRFKKKRNTREQERV
jgi:hypothetical protein